MGSWDRTKGVVSANIKQSVVKREREINSLEKMQDIVKKNSALIVDVRSKDIFLKGHIPNARSIPLSKFDDLIGDFYKTWQLDQKMVVYCSSPECTDSHTFATKLFKMGYENVLVFPGGFNGWKKEGLKIEKD